MLALEEQRYGDCLNHELTYTGNVRMGIGLLKIELTMPEVVIIRDVLVIGIYFEELPFPS